MLSTVHLSAATAAPLAVKNERATRPAPAEIPSAYAEKRDTARVSTIALQLGESAVRAEIRDAASDRKTLAAEANRMVDQLVGPKYQANSNQHNQEVPRTDNAELLQRAVSATAFVTLKEAGDPRATNPFAGLSHEQLILIAYDDQGPYTVNERRAAWEEAEKTEQAWQRKVVALGDTELAATGGNPRFYANALAHYQTLPAIEKSQYPDDYEAQLQARMLQEPGRKTEDRQYNLFEILAGMQQPKPEDPEEKSQKAKAAMGALAKLEAPVNVSIASGDAMHVGETSATTTASVAVVSSAVKADPSSAEALTTNN